ncbi:hypothetical protein ACYSMR_15690 [Kocuria sp. U4B]
MFNAPVYLTHHASSERFRDSVTHSLVQVHGATTSPINKSALQAVAIQGVAVFGSRVIFDIHGLQEYVNQFKNIEDLVAGASNVRGSVCYQVFDSRTSQYALLNDPLGAGIYFRYKTPELRAISSHTRPLRDVISAMGITVRRNPAYAAAELLTGTSCYGSDTPYENVDAIAPGHCIVLDADGAVSTMSYGTNEMIENVSEWQYGELLDLAHHEIGQNFKALTEVHGLTKISDLTAGFDSRLILAGLMSTNQHHDFYYHCMKDTSDWSIASQLAHEFDLNITTSYGNSLARQMPYNYREQKLFLSHLSDDVLTHSYASRFHPGNVVGLQGGYGETFRTFNSVIWTDGPDSADLFAYSLWRWADFPAAEERASSIYAPQLLDEVTNKAKGALTQSISTGLGADAATNWLYLKGRNRYWIGQNSFYNSAIRIQLDPLYSVAGAAGSLRLPFYERRANFLGLDLMRRWQERLASLPFDKEKISPLYEKKRATITRSKFKCQSYTDIQTVDPEPQGRMQPVVQYHGITDKPSHGDRETAKALGISPLVLQGLSNYRRVAIEALNETPALQQVYNVANCTRLLSNPFNNSDSAKRADKLLTALIRSRSI